MDTRGTLAHVSVVIAAILIGFSAVESPAFATVTFGHRSNRHDRAPAEACESAPQYIPQCSDIDLREP